MPKGTPNDTHGRSLKIVCKKGSCDVWTGKSSVFTHNMDYNADMFGLLCEFLMSTLWENSPLLEWERIHEFTSPILNNFNKNCGLFPNGICMLNFEIQPCDMLGFVCYMFTSKSKAPECLSKSWNYALKTGNILLLPRSYWTIWRDTCTNSCEI